MQNPNPVHPVLAYMPYINLALHPAALYGSFYLAKFFSVSSTACSTTSVGLAIGATISIYAQKPAFVRHTGVSAVYGFALGLLLAAKPGDQTGMLFANFMVGLAWLIQALPAEPGPAQARIPR